MKTNGTYKFRPLFSQILVTALCILGPTSSLISCMQTEPIDASKSNDPNDNDQVKPDSNGRLNLPVEILKITPASDTSQPNGFYIKTLSNVNSVVKDYAFTVSQDNAVYSLNFNEVMGTSCSTTPVGNFYIIGNNGNNYQQIHRFVNFGLQRGNYHLQFRVENLNCLGITLRFGLKNQR